MIVIMSKPVRRTLVGLGIGLGMVAGWLSMGTAQAVPHGGGYSETQIRRMLASEAQETIVPPALALAVAKAESNFNDGAVSHKGAVGVMQIMPQTAWSIYRVRRDDLFDARLNIQIGVDFLQRLYRRYGRWDLALSHYNGGSRVGTPPNARVIPATRGYVDKVLALRTDYERTTALAALDSAQQTVEEDRALARRQAEAAYAMIEGPQIEQNWRDYLKAAEYWLTPAGERSVADLAMNGDPVSPQAHGAGTAYLADDNELVYAEAPSARLKRRISDLKRRFRWSLETDQGRWQPVLGDARPYWEDRP